jgi:hypothetical protein
MPNAERVMTKHVKLYEVLTLAYHKCQVDTGQRVFQ